MSVKPLLQPCKDWEDRTSLKTGASSRGGFEEIEIGAVILTGRGREIFL